MLDELEKQMVDLQKGVYDMLAWVEKFASDDTFNSKNGKKLVNDICEMARYYAYLHFDMAAILLEQC